MDNASIFQPNLIFLQVAGQILSVFPEIAAQATPSTGKVLIHHTCLKTSAIMSQDAIKVTYPNHSPIILWSNHSS